MEEIGAVMHHGVCRAEERPETYRGAPITAHVW